MYPFASVRPKTNYAYTQNIFKEWKFEKHVSGVPVRFVSNGLHPVRLRRQSGLYHNLHNYNLSTHNFTSSSNNVCQAGVGSNY